MEANLNNENAVPSNVVVGKDQLGLKPSAHSLLLTPGKKIVSATPIKAHTTYKKFQTPNPKTSIESQLTESTSCSSTIVRPKTCSKLPLSTKSNKSKMNEALSSTFG